MGNVVSMTLALPPTTNQMYRVVNKRIVKSKVARDYEAYVVKYVLVDESLRLFDLQGPYDLTVEFYLKRPRDVDNVKCLVDAASRAFGFDDDAITSLRITKHMGAAVPRVEVTLRAVEPCAHCAAGAS